MSSIANTLTPLENCHYSECKSNGMFNNNAVQLSKFNHHVLKALQGSKVSQKEFELVVKDAIQAQALDTAAEIKILEKNLESLKISIQAMEQVEQECKNQGLVQARRWVNSFAGIIIT